MTVERLQTELNRKRDLLREAAAAKYREYQAVMAELERVEAAIDALRGAERGIRLATEVLGDSKVGRPA